MSFKEIKDEYKNQEGDPHVKSALRQRRMQMLQRGAMDSVAEADFVVRNPTHVACALKYDAETMMSPTMLMKGAELIAKEIIKIAEENIEYMQGEYDKKLDIRKSRVLEYYKNGVTSLEDISYETNDPAEAIFRDKIIELVTKYDADLIEEIEAEKNAIDEEKKELEGNKIVLADL